MDLPPHTLDFVAIAFGLVLLFFGKKLFWIFIGGAGFLAGVAIASNLPGVETQSESAVLIVGFVFGIIGILAAIFLKRVAFRIAGFIAGVLIAYWIVEVIKLTEPVWVWTSLGLGGLIGLLLIVAIFDAALIILSGITGAMMIITSAPIPKELENALFVGLSILGIVVQFQILKSTKPKLKPADDD